MPLTLNVASARKSANRFWQPRRVVQRGDRTAGQRDLRRPGGVSAAVRQAYSACTEAVTAELARHQQPAAAPPSSPPASNGNGRSRTHGPTAVAQLCQPGPRLKGHRRSPGSRFGRELHTRFGVDQPEELSITEASQCIDEFKAFANGRGSGRR